MKTPTAKRHFTASNSVRDIVIGMADGLTVPFALAAGLSGVVSTTSIIRTAGLAEIAAGAIAMGLGGYLAARGDAEHYFSERDIEEMEVRETAEVEMGEVAEVFRAYGLTTAESQPVVDALRQRQSSVQVRAISGPPGTNLGAASAVPGQGAGDELIGFN